MQCSHAGEGRPSTAAAAINDYQPQGNPVSFSIRYKGEGDMCRILRIVGLGALLMALGSPAHAEPLTRDQVVGALPKFELLAQKIVDDSGVPGLSVAIVFKDKLVY